MDRLCKIGKFILGIILLIIFCVLVLFSTFGVHAAAIDEETVLNDLRQDPNFKVEDYPDAPTDYSLQVIQLSETKENELVVYVYQPSNKTIDLLGTKISISYGFSKDGKGLNPKLYDLSLLSSNGVFDKYLIKDFPVPGDSQRYYNIVSIFREFNEVVDTQSDNNFNFSDISYSVGQQWYIYDINDSKGYEMATFKTLTLDTMFDGNVEFTNGLTWGNFVGAFKSGDCWFIAFNCEEYIIKHIYDADMTYSKKHVTENWLMFQGSTYTDSDVKENIPIRLTDNDVMSYTGNGLGAKTYQWNRILSSSEFIKNVEKNNCNLSDVSKSKIQNSQWVFTFLETERTHQDYEGGYTNTYYNIYDVGILRLHFMDITGKTYDLGVVNSLTDPDNKPDGVGSALLTSMEEFFEKLFMILGIVILVLIFMFFSNLLTPFITIIKEIWKAIKYVLSLPFKIIKWVFRRK